MRKITTITLILGLILSFSFFYTNNTHASPSVSLQVIKLPLSANHLSIWGNEAIICGRRHIKQDDGYEKDVVALGVANVNGGGFSLIHAPIPDKNPYPIPWPPEKNIKYCLASAKYDPDKYAVSTTHDFIMWKVGDNYYDYSNSTGWGPDDLVVFNGMLLGNAEDVISIHHYKKKYDLITEPFIEFSNKYMDSFSFFMMPVYKNKVILLGNGYMVLDKNFHIIKDFYPGIDEEWIGPSQIGQSAYDIYKGRYILYLSDSDGFLVVFDGETYGTHTFKLPIISINGNPAGPTFITVTPSGIVYVAILNNQYQGKIVAYKFNEKNFSLTKLWEKDMPGHIYAMDNYGETVYIAMGEDGVGVLTTSISFSDVPKDYWAYDAIMNLASKGIISGYPDGTFKPDKGVSRAEFAKMLAVYLNLPLKCEPNLPEIKKDVHAGDWFCPYVSAVVKAGYMKGYGGGRFGPGDPVKKEEILTTIVRIKGWNLISPDNPTFPDVPKSHWAYPYIETAVAHGLVKKVDPHITDGNFHLGVPATRAQTAVFMYRMGQ